MTLLARLTATRCLFCGKRHSRIRWEWRHARRWADKVADEVAA